MKTCSDCKHSDGSLVWNDLLLRYDVIHKCLLGNTEECLEWWKNNGYKIRYQNIFDEMPCHEYHDSTKMIIEMNNTAEKILDALKRFNNEKN